MQPNPRLGARGSPSMLRGEVIRRKASCSFVPLCGKASRLRARTHARTYTAIMFFAVICQESWFSGTFEQVQGFFKLYHGTVKILPRYCKNSTAVLSRHFRGAFSAQLQAADR